MQVRRKAAIWRGKTRDAQPRPREEQPRAGSTGAPVPKGEVGAEKAGVWD